MTREVTAADLTDEEIRELRDGPPGAAVCTRAATDLPSFAGGELSVEAADAYRAHLITCEACQLELVDHVALEARISALPQPTTLDVVNLNELRRAVRAYLAELDAWRDCDRAGEELSRAEVVLRQLVWNARGIATSNARLADALSRLGADVEPDPGWQDRVWRRIGHPGRPPRWRRFCAWMWPWS